MEALCFAEVVLALFTEVLGASCLVFGFVLCLVLVLDLVLDLVLGLVFFSDACACLIFIRRRRGLDCLHAGPPSLYLVLQHIY